jgi:hypothetical protein
MSKPLHFEFDGIVFRQNPKAPELFGFVAPAEALIKLCGVARKSERMLTNYQRALDTTRVEREVTPFFQEPQNCSPTAVVLSIHESPTTTITFTDVVEGSALKRMTVETDDIDALTEDQAAETKRLGRPLEI